MPSILLCFDSKVATDAFASETENKFHILADNVMALAADRPGRARELASYYRAHLATVNLDEVNLLAELDRPVQVLKRRIASAYIGRKFGVSYQEFLDHGINWFGQAAVDKYRNDIESNPLGVDMIIVGFFKTPAPTLWEPFVCELRGEQIDRVTNFSLIGTGAYTAEPALHSRNQMPRTPLPDTVYNIYEAKRTGESSPQVGKETRMYVLQAPWPHDKKLRVMVLNQNGEKEMAKRYKKYGPKKVPMQTLDSWMFLPGSY